MVARIHDIYYDAKATLLSEADIKEIRESRGRIPNATQKMASKFHIGPKRVYEIWDNKERLRELEKNIRDAKVESSKSTDSALEKGGSKAKKTGGKKSKSKSTLVELTPSSIQTQPIQTSKKDINNVNLDASYEKMVKKAQKS
ncbi:uncharacterized protein OCT59_004324 [Rhizophagus irregularis]|uniref:uncharacterized protein n=1 Tax=Rhizophagus irregularis TaxID=588596 RepID=UPI00332BBE33|nr:hypothetical protein OCT59_004324 [Rhizophagus irregularis]